VPADKSRPTETAARLNSGAIHLLRALRRVDRESGLTPARLSALSVLVFGGPCTLGRLAAIEDVAGPTMTRIVDGLVELGHVVREAHPDSARSVLITATPRGTALMHAAADRRARAIVSAMAGLSERERATLAKAAPTLIELAGRIRGTDGSVGDRARS
jgi:DNA-binding MarR family transcriptional regulator